MATRIHEVSGRSSRGFVAIRAYKVTEGPVNGGAAIPVVKITDSDLKENGGNFIVAGNAPYEILVYEVTDGLVQGGTAMPIYIVNDTPAGLSAPYNLVAT